MNPTLKQAVKYMESKREKNTCSMFKYSIKIVHGDGSIFLLENVYVEELKFGKSNMLLVYTEHCGYFAFYMEDLEDWRIYK